MMVRRKLVVAVAFALCTTAPIAIAASFSDFEQVSQLTPEDATPYKVLPVDCPAGKTAIGGGAAIFWTTSPTPKLISTFQIGQSWYGEAESSDGQAWSLFVQANCAIIVN
jgi:hypothetical protein